MLRVVHRQTFQFLKHHVLNHNQYVHHLTIKWPKHAKTKILSHSKHYQILISGHQCRRNCPKCTSCEEIRQIVTSEDRDYHMPITSLTYLNDTFIMELIATDYYPSDTPSHITPVRCYGNGNHFMRSISKLVFGTVCHHLAVRAAIVFKAVIHKNYFLDDTYWSGEHVLSYWQERVAGNYG